MIKNFSIDNASYLLVRDSTSNHAQFSQIDKELRLQLPRHSQPKESLTEACRSILGIDLGGACLAEKSFARGNYLDALEHRDKVNRIYAALKTTKL